MTQNERQRLIDLSWRYAALIGITNLDDMVPKEIIDEDRRRWAHLIKQGPSGKPAFIDEEAIEFMRELSGMSDEDCAEVLQDEWSLGVDKLA